jgi:amino acid adenylation domain-containing protein
VKITFDNAALQMTPGLSNPQATFTPVDFDPFQDGELGSVASTTESQREIWLSVKNGDEANCAYNESQSLWLHGSLDVGALQSALQELVQRHEALRTTFSPDGAFLCVALSTEITIPLIDLSRLSNGDRQTKLDFLRREAVIQPFDLVRGPLFRAQIIQCRDQEHLVMITAHHIVCDGWSWGVLLPDLAALYSAALNQTTADLEAPLRFSEYALLQEDLIQSPAYVAAEQYWLDQFSDQIPVLDLALDRPRPAVKSYSANREDWQLNQSLVDQLKKVGAKSGCSFFTTLLAGFEVFLHRLSGQSDLVVGVPAAGQSFAEQEQLVGHCVNFLPMHSHIDGEQVFADYARKRNSQMLDAYEHQQITFGGLIQKLAIERDPSRTPLVSVVFNYDRALTSRDLQFDGLEAEVSSNPRYFENFELFVNASEVNGKLVLECQYNTDLFDAETIRRWMEAFEVLLSGIVADPSQPIWKLPILLQNEQQLLNSWNDTQVNYPIQCIHQQFEAQVERTPTAIAVVFENQTLTYQALNAQANRLARYLQSLGVGPEVLVGICVERSLEMVVGLLAILKAGGAYVPLDPAHPAERIAYMLQDTATPILLTQKSLLDRLPDHLPDHPANLICLDEGWDADQTTFSQEKDENLAIAVTPSNLAYVIYTSGSTGLPKGVQIEHRSVANLLNSVKHQPGLTDRDTLLSVTTITFDISVAEIFLPLIVGARLVIASHEVATDGAKLLQLLKTSKATFLQPTPVTWQLLLAAGWKGSDSLKMVSTGEALTRELANQLLLKSPLLWNLYGPTETTIWSAVDRVESGTGSVSIGRPLDNTQFYILDAHLQPVPIGVPGELYIGGDGLARGYLNRTELTAEKFIPHPFSQKPGARLYKTGDLVRYLPDGRVECLGRIDYQVKIRGFRIELGEIEAVLNQHPAVQEVVIVACETTSGYKQLVAYIVSALGQQLDAHDLRTFVNGKLPGYMIPTAFVFLEKLPLTSSGKVNRKVLPLPDADRPDTQSFVAPRNQLELQLTRIWETVLDRKPIGVTANFFELGGHSLLAATLLSEVEKTFKKELPFITLFQAPTIEQLANILSQSAWSPPCPSMVVIQPGGPQPPLFCIHVLGRGLKFYLPLVGYLGRSQPIYGLSTQLMDEDQAPPNRVEDLAAYYIQEMRTIQPQGPYFLTGISFGGLVAYEIAQQLRAQGETIALLALLDTYNSKMAHPQRTNKRSQKYLRLSRVVKLLQLGQVNVALDKAGMNLKGKIERINDRIKQIRCQVYQQIGRPLPDELQDFLYQRANIDASNRYTPQVYSGQVTFFKVTINLGGGISPEASWRELVTGGLEVHTVPGDHLGMLKEPNVKILGQKLRACLDKVLVSSD